MKRIYFGLCLFILLGNQCLRAGLNDGLIAYYPFDGNTKDASGYGNDATPNGVVSFESGVMGQAASFSQSWLQIPNFLNNLQSFSISLWVNERGMTNAGPGDAEGAGEAYIWFGDNENGYAGIASWGGSWANVGDTNVAIVSGLDYVSMQNVQVDLVKPKSEWRNRWHHLAMTYDSLQGLRSLFIDGVFINQKTMAKVSLYGVGAIASHTWWYGSTRSYRLLGLIDDVRIYNRALSPSEVQALYFLPNVGTAPTPPTVVQTNRTPSSTELGSQTSGSFKVFTNGNFVSGVALDPSKKTVVLTHGWNDNPTTWPWLMAETLQLELGASTLNIVAWDWRTNAQSVLPWTAAAKTPEEGQSLGASLLAALGANYSQPIHFIGHSFGTLVNAGAANYLQANGYSWTNMQMTLFDEAEVGSGSASNILQTAASTITAILANDSGPLPFWYHPLPTNCAWADNYITAFGMLHPQAANVILTNDFPIATIMPQAAYDEIVTFHGYPMTWYDDSITTPFGSSLGFRRSFEENGLTPPPATNTFFIQAFSSSDLDLATTSFSSASQLLNTRLKNMLNPIYYSLVQAAPGPLQAAGQINAGIQDTLTQDPYAFTTGLPEAWGINVNLATSSSSSGSSPTPQIKAQPLGLTPNDASSSTNVPAFVWIPLAVPSNAVSMSFDFIFQGDGASDSFAVALNGTNVFSLETSLIQTSVMMNSGQIDVSQYAGTNVELFLGIVGGTSTNANLTVSGIRFYSIVAPSLQAQTAGNNFVLTWPLSASDYVLETSTNCTSWTTNADVPVIVDLQNTVTNPISSGARFYRLKK
jgi:pimeloyl-ACP methyl ester carboxylesterase